MQLLMNNLICFQNAAYERSPIKASTILRKWNELSFDLKQKIDSNPNPNLVQMLEIAVELGSNLNEIEEVFFFRRKGSTLLQGRL